MFTTYGCSNDHETLLAARNCIDCIINTALSLLSGQAAVDVSPSHGCQAPACYQLDRLCEPVWQQILATYGCSNDHETLHAARKHCIANFIINTTRKRLSINTCRPLPALSSHAMGNQGNRAGSTCKMTGTPGTPPLEELAMLQVEVEDAGRLNTRLMLPSCLKHGQLGTTQRQAACLAPPIHGGAAYMVTGAGASTRAHRWSSSIRNMMRRWASQASMPEMRRSWLRGWTGWWKLSK